MFLRYNLSSMAYFLSTLSKFRYVVCCCFLAGFIIVPRYFYHVNSTTQSVVRAPYPSSYEESKQPETIADSSRLLSPQNSRGGIEESTSPVGLVAQKINDMLQKQKERALYESQQVEKKYQVLIAPDVPKIPVNSATYVRKIDTNKPVVFLTIDDGITKSPEAVDFIRSKRLNPTLFLTDKTTSDNYDYFKQFQKDSIVIENHTLTHHSMTKLGLEAQKAEICGQNKKITDIYGVRPTLFRAPYGASNAITFAAARQCGITAVVHWSAIVNGGSLQYQTGNHLVAGDIVLMHFRKEIMQDLQAFYDEVTSKNLTPAFLSSWL